MERFKVLPKDELEKLPKTTGVYAFYVKRLNPKPYTLNPIYIGKAVNIQGRVKNHFNQPSYRDNLFIDKVDKIGYFETNNSEIEALILEANLIKKYQPKYNVVWKDDKNYFYVAIIQNDQKIPYIFITHQPRTIQNVRSDILYKNIYIGPFVEGTALKKTLRFLRKIFSYYTSAKHSKNKCTYCHLDLCPGPYENLAAPRHELGAKIGDPFFEYKKNIKKLILILKGKRNAVLSSLKKEMKQASSDQNFEKAGKIRDEIYNLQQVMSHTRIINQQDITHRENHAIAYFLLQLGIRKKTYRIECYDVSNIQGKQATGSMVVFINGVPDKSQYRKFKIRLPEKPNDIGMLKEILERRFKRLDWPMPKAILIDGGKAQLNATLSVIARSEATKQSRVCVQNSGLPRSPAGSLAMTVMAVAKGRQELFIEGREKPIPLKQLPQEVYNLIKQLDDEAHRFAIAYHKTLRKKSIFH